MAEIGTDISKAKEILESGELVAIPTETVYGLAGNAFNETALTKIFVTKNRPKFDPLIAHIDSESKLNELTNKISPLSRILTQNFWPGPLTILFEKNPEVPDLLTSGLDTVAVRKPSHPMTLELISQLDFPLAAPSANPFGYVSPTTAQHVQDQLGEKITYILDGGPCEVGLESTIVQADEKITVHRIGGIPAEQLEKYGTVQMKESTDNPTAPGQLSSHYSPGVRLIQGDVELLRTQFPNQNIGIISFSRNYSNVKQLRILSPKADLSEAARNLFRVMREMDQQDIDIVLAEIFPEHGLGLAINDRLKRASIKG